MASHLNPIDVKRFDRDGYLVARSLADPNECRHMAAVARESLAPLAGPAEFEADIGYPGAPASRNEQGGDTPRRLLHAYTRDAGFRQWSTGSRIGRRLGELMGAPVLLSQCHHNCVMTKHPGYSSVTAWHQDVRYWSFDRPELISVWLALGREREHNGALKVIPGSHRLDLDRGRFDQKLFLRSDLAENQALIDSAEVVELEPGDVLFFHCRLFHAAGMNRSDEVKLSAVFTYHDANNRPIPGTRSAHYPSIAVQP